jgi:hypothetical protein
MADHPAARFSSGGQTGRGRGGHCPSGAEVQPFVRGATLNIAGRLFG